MLYDRVSAVFVNKYIVPMPVWIDVTRPQALYQLSFPRLESYIPRSAFVTSRDVEIGSIIFTVFVATRSRSMGGAGAKIIVLRKAVIEDGWTYMSIRYHCIPAAMASVKK